MTVSSNFKNVVELGCHYLNTVLEHSEFKNSNIWVVDAVSDFLDLIPNTENVVKICKAVTPGFNGKATMRGILLPDQQKHNLPEWSTTMATLKDQHPTITKFDWVKHLTEFEVECLSIKDLWSTYNIPKNIDFLSTDLEGLDYEVLISLLKNNITPNIIRFESKLMNNTELEHIKSFLKEKGYKDIVPGSQIDFAQTPYNHWAWLDNKPVLDMT